VLVLYHSVSGNTRFVAQCIAEATSGKLLEVRSKEKLGSDFMRYSWDGRADIKGLTLVHEKVDLKDHHTLFIGTPVWAWAPSPVIHSFLANNPVSGKRVALFSTSEGNPGSTLDRLLTLLPGNEFLGSMDFREPLKADRDAITAKASGWAERMLRRQASSMHVPKGATLANLISKNGV